MSATGRNLLENPRHENDFYETPPWCTRAILPFLPPGYYLDAGTGSGAILREVLAAGRSCVGIESDSKFSSPSIMCGDFFDIKPNIYDVVIGNPPFLKAQEFAEHGIRVAKTCALLLRLNWLASKRRIGFHREHPADVFVLSKRPSFTGNGKTDATEYAWFLWGEGRGNRWFLLDIPK
jgi:hypothetical protein